MSLNVLSPITIGPYELKNRVWMAPLTRCRADADRAPTAMNAEYYRQRAGAGLIIAEATQISPRGVGYPATPGIHSEKQVEGWKGVTRAVHEAGGRIFLQLWHCGRISHSDFHGGEPPLSSSAVAAKGMANTPSGPKPYETPRAMTIEEIRGTIRDYRTAAENALRAGFDGVELHGANGYLPDQFLRDAVNQRTDEYGGPIENRARFMLEAIRQLIDVWGASRVGVRLSPSGSFGDMGDSNRRATFGYAVTELGKLGLAYLHIMEAMEGDIRHGEPGYEQIPVSFFRPMTKTPIVTNAGFTHDKANAYIREGWADAVAFGQLFIANPDLPARFAKGATLNVPDPSTFYGGGEKGYTDYPAMG